MKHLEAQKATVRMLFDPAFAAAARREPDRVLAALDPALRRQLCAVDERALRQDRLRRRRALHTLCEEWKATTTLALAETRSLAFLDEFFCSAAFHRAVDERGSMPLAFAQFLGEALFEGRLRTPLLAGVLAIETALAQARRSAPAQPSASTAPVSTASAAPVPTTAPPELGPDSGVALAAGVLALEVAAGAMAALQQCERYLFEVSLMPAVALCDDAPSLVLDAATADRARLHLVTVPAGGVVSLVTVEAPLHAVLRCLSPTPRRARDVVAEAVARGLDATDAWQRLRGLVEDEIVEVR